MILLRHGQSHFNVVFSTTRRDPGYVDPGLTSVGREQAAAAAESLGAYDIARIVASPYARTLETAEIIAGVLALSVSIEPIIRERAFFRCDIGSPRSDLSRRWPRFDFADLPERWWPEPEESEAELSARCAQFTRDAAAWPDWRQVLIVTHWGFIRGLTGEEAPNAAIIHFDPRRPGLNAVVREAQS